MRLLTATVVAACLLVLPTSNASARASGDVLLDRHNINPFQFVPTKPHSRRRIARVNRVRHHARHRTVTVPYRVVSRREVRIVSHPAGCPRTAFCGCGIAAYFHIKDRSLWLAANWLRFPRAAAAPGMVAARRGHVFAILKVIRPGIVLAYDPNSGGHRTRIHERRLAGFVVVNPRRGRAA